MLLKPNKSFSALNGHDAERYYARESLKLDNQREPALLTFMQKRTIAAALFSVAASLTATVAARADIIQTLSVNLNNGGSGTASYFDSTDSYDFISFFRLLAS